MHRKHDIDQGTEVTEGSGAWGGIPVGSLSPRHNCTASDFQDLVRRLSNLYCPQAYSSAVSHLMSTSRLWTVGKASVGTESVGIVWCTRPPTRTLYA